MWSESLLGKEGAPYLTICACVKQEHLRACIHVHKYIHEYTCWALRRTYLARRATWRGAGLLIGLTPPVSKPRGVGQRPVAFPSLPLLINTPLWPDVKQEISRQKAPGE